MAIIDLLPDLQDVVGQSRSELEFRSRLWSWLDAQRTGPLGPLLSDIFRLWSGIGATLSLDEATQVLRHAGGGAHVRRAEAVLARVEALAGERPDCDVVLVAGLKRPEGYSRFDRGRNTVFLGVDHPASLRHADHFEVILSHELTHALRDPRPEIQADYGGWPDMGHDEFVNRYTFREHLVSESLATAMSERAFPHKEERRYVYFDPEAYQWCEENRDLIARRILQAIERGEDYRTFYAEGSVSPDSPDCCDYYFGFHLGRFALSRAEPRELLRLPARQFLGRFLESFVAEFVGEEERARQADPPSGPLPAVVPSGEAIDQLIEAEDVRACYRDLMLELSGNPQATRDSTRAFEEGVKRSRLEYAGEPFDVYAFPLVLSPEDEGYLRWVCEKLLRAFEKVIELYRRDPQVRAYFGFPAHIEELMLLEPHYRPFVQVARFDSYWDGCNVRFLELNTHGTSGIVLAERLGELWGELPQLSEVLRRHPMRTPRLRRRLLHTLLSCWRQAQDARGVEDAGTPRLVAVLDWANLATRTELAHLADFFRAHGLPARVVDPKELMFDGETLSAGGEPIDVVYRRLTTLDLLERSAQLEPFLAASRAGKVVVVGPFASDLAHSKRLFAFLTEERWRRCFSMDERALIDAHVPWTRLFKPGRTLYQGKVYDLKQLALEQRERFVLKPTEGFEGRGVVLGVEATPQQWSTEVERRYGGDHILQEYVQAPLRTFVLARGERVDAVPLHQHLGEYVFGGRLAGYLARGSQELVLSAASQERAIPCLVLQGDLPEETAGDVNHP